MPVYFKTHLSKIRAGKKEAICANTYFPLFIPNFSGNNLNSNQIVTAYFLAVIAFTIEENYRELIRNLYQQLTENRITFKNFGKYFHFASGEFVSAFVIFIISIFILLKKQENKKRIRNMILGTLLLIISTILFCYIDSNGKLIECTACDDGKRVLRFNDVKYDLIFISSLIFGILPTIITEIRNRKKASH